MKIIKIEYIKKSWTRHAGGSFMIDTENGGKFSATFVDLVKDGTLREDSDYWEAIGKQYDPK